MRPARRWPARLALLLALLPAAAGAAAPDEAMRDPAQEARARKLSVELRCLVCQNQSLDDSDAALARDLRRLVRERIAAGDTDEGVKRFLVQRYGDFVLLRPPFDGRTALPWASPLVALALGLLLLRRRARPAPPAAPLTPDEERALAGALGEAPPRG